MDLALHDKWALVTDGSWGIGELIVRTLSREGAKVIVHGRSVRRAEAVASAIRASGGAARICVGDLARNDEAARVAEEAFAASRGIDILVNHAGAHPANGWFDSTTETWRARYEADVPSARRMIQGLVPGMVKRGWGRVINVGGSLSRAPNDLTGSRAEADSTHLDITVNLSKALESTGITVNSVSPGVISVGVEDVLRRCADASASGDWTTSGRNWLEQVLAHGTLDRMQTPRELAELVAFVASPRAGSINGASLAIEGSRTAQAGESGASTAETTAKIAELLGKLLSARTAMRATDGLNGVRHGYHGRDHAEHGGNAGEHSL